MDILLYLSLIPSVLFGYYIYKCDKIEREPFQLLFRCFIGGIIAGIIVIVISYLLDVNSYYLDSQLNILVYAFIGVSLIEEFFKFIIIYLICYKDKEFNYMYDAIVYSSFVALGFGILENILYISTYNDILIALARGIITVPAHIFFSIFMGYYLGLARHYKRYKSKKEKYNLVKALFVPVMLHGFFDYCLFSDNDLMTLFFIVFEAILYLVSIRKVKEVSADGKHI